MVLVDTSVWIRFLANRAPFAGKLDELLSEAEVCGHDFVIGELLIGDRGGRKQLLADYALMHHAPVVPHREVVEFVRQRRLHGRGIGWIDTHLLASALVSHIKLWTADPRLEAAARELGIDYE
jgi:predicted nucleic acid-binding protein